MLVQTTDTAILLDGDHEHVVTFLEKLDGKYAPSGPWWVVPCTKKEVEATLPEGCRVRKPFAFLDIPDPAWD